MAENSGTWRPADNRVAGRAARIQPASPVAPSSHLRCQTCQNARRPIEPELDARSHTLTFARHANPTQAILSPPGCLAAARLIRLERHRFPLREADESVGREPNRQRQCRPSRGGLGWNPRPDSGIGRKPPVSSVGTEITFTRPTSQPFDHTFPMASLQVNLQP